MVTMMGYIISTTALTTNKFHRGTNRLFLDTADQSNWNVLLPVGMFHGITTNPRLLEQAKEECSVPNLHRMAQNALSYPGCDEFMCQTWGYDEKQMYDIGMDLSELDRERIVIKVPMTVDGTKAAARLIRSGVRVCLTACYNAKQAVIAAGMGAEYLSPYLGRMKDSGKNALAECKTMEEIVKGIGSETRILVASIRDVNSMSELMRCGMNTFTMKPALAVELFDELPTREAARFFDNSYGVTPGATRSSTYPTYGTSTGYTRSSTYPTYGTTTGTTRSSTYPTHGTTTGTTGSSTYPTYGTTTGTTRRRTYETPNYYEEYRKQRNTQEASKYFDDSRNFRN